MHSTLSAPYVADIIAFNILEYQILKCELSMSCDRVKACSGHETDVIERNSPPLTSNANPHKTKEKGRPRRPIQISSIYREGREAAFRCGCEQNLTT